MTEVRKMNAILLHIDSGMQRGSEGNIPASWWLGLERRIVA
jgi:hypothetical protein